MDTKTKAPPQSVAEVDGGGPSSKKIKIHTGDAVPVPGGAAVEVIDVAAEMHLRRGDGIEVKWTINDDDDDDDDDALRLGEMGCVTTAGHRRRSGGKPKEGERALRLCFAGSATLGSQILHKPSPLCATATERDRQGSGNMTEKQVVPLTSDEMFNFSLFGDYSSKFSFSANCGLPGRVYHSGAAAWEQFLANAPPDMFERRGGAAQFGINTALGLPIDSRDAGKVVVVLYSQHNREKDEKLVNQMRKDLKLFNPCPRWKLVVDVRSGSSNDGEAGAEPQSSPSSPPTMMSTLENSRSCSAGMSALSVQSKTESFTDLPRKFNEETSQLQSTKPLVLALVSLLQENMPSHDHSSPLRNQLHNPMSLRLLLLRSDRIAEEERLVETLLAFFESYVAAGRTRPDTAFLVARDYEFHVRHQQHNVLSPVLASSGSIQLPQQQPQHLPGVHSFNGPGPLGGMPQTTLAGASTYVPSLAPLPILQNIVHAPSLPPNLGGH